MDILLLLVPPAVAEDVTPELLREGWTKTVPIPAPELGEGDRYVLSVEQDWLHVKRETGAGKTDWHIVLARATDPTPPEIVAVEGKLPFAVSYRQGRYFVREWIDILRCVREPKPRKAGSLIDVKFPDQQPEPSAAWGMAYTSELESLPSGWIGGWDRDGWFTIASGPQPGIVDCMLRLNPEDNRGAGYGFQGTHFGGLCRVFHDETWIMDDGEMLVAARTVEAVHKMRTERQTVLENLPGSPAPALDGTKWLNIEAAPSWNDLEGKVVLLDFWSTTCVPCVKKLPEVQALYEKHRDKGLVVIGIHEAADDTEELEEFSKELKLTFPLVMDSGETAKRYAVESLPTYLLVDEQGKIVTGPSIHPPSEEEIERLLERKAHAEGQR